MFMFGKLEKLSLKHSEHCRRRQVFRKFSRKSKIATKHFATRKHHFRKLVADFPKIYGGFPEIFGNF